MGRFDRSDDDFLVRLQKKAHLEHDAAVKRGEVVSDTVLPACRARGPGNVRCDQHAGHTGDHSGLASSGHDAQTAGSHRSEFARSRRGNKVRHIRGSERVKWAPVCTSTVRSVEDEVTCRLPAGHQGKHMQGAVTWTDEQSRVPSTPTKPGQEIYLSLQLATGKDLDALADIWGIVRKMVEHDAPLGDYDETDDQLRLRVENTLDAKWDL